MKLFIDTASIKEIREAASWGIICGVTTNPSLMAKEAGSSPKGIKELYKETLQEICSLISGPISAEVTSVTQDGMVAEGRELAQIAPNIVIKVPMGEEGIKAVRSLTAEGIKVNVTLVFSANQALLAALAGATFVSPFIGRLDDAGEDGMRVIEDIRQIYDNYGFGTQILTASVRHPVHVTQAAKLGSDIATCPFKVLKQLFNHPLTGIGLERFLADWQSVSRSQVTLV